MTYGLRITMISRISIINSDLAVHKQGEVDGITGSVDLNISFKNYAG
jgi:hypothetical protein